MWSAETDTGLGQLVWWDPSMLPRGFNDVVQVGTKCRWSLRAFLSIPYPAPSYLAIEGDLLHSAFGFGAGWAQLYHWSDFLTSNSFCYAKPSGMYISHYSSYCDDQEVNWILLFLTAPFLDSNAYNVRTNPWDHTLELPAWQYPRNHNKH